MINTEFKQKILQFFRKKDRFAMHNGIEVLDVSEGWAKAQVLLTDNHMNGMSIAHGGIVFTLADVVFGLAANSYGRVALTLNADISFFNPAAAGMLITAEAEELSIRHTVASYLVSVRDESGLLLASMKCQAYRKNTPVELV